MDSETVVSAVLKQLQSIDPKAKRYRGAQVQNITRPCYFVEQIGLGFEKQMNTRVKRNPRIKITHLGKEDISELDKYLRSVGENLLQSFQKLCLSDTELVFGRNLEYEIVNGELIFTVEYPMHTVPVSPPQPKFRTFDPHYNTKN